MLSQSKMRLQELHPYFHWQNRRRKEKKKRNKEKDNKMEKKEKTAETGNSDGQKAIDFSK